MTASNTFTVLVAEGQRANFDKIVPMLTRECGVAGVFAAIGNGEDVGPRPQDWLSVQLQPGAAARPVADALEHARQTKLLEKVWAPGT